MHEDIHSGPLGRLVRRLREMADAVTQGRDAVSREFTMRVPAEPERDADLVLSTAANEIERLQTARPLAEWHEDKGPTLWWRFPIDEPPYCGTPLDSDWPGYHTHWTQIAVPEPPNNPN